MTSIGDFPPEILWEILNYLDIKQLFVCRLVNSQWNQICSQLLNDKFLLNYESNHSQCQWNVDIFARAKVPLESAKSLETFCKWFSRSSESSNTSKAIPCICPLSFARVKLNSGGNFKDVKVLQFLSTVGPCVKSLELEFCNTKAETVAEFWTSINQYMPNVEELFIHFGFLLLPIHSNQNQNQNHNVTNKLDIINTALQNKNSINNSIKTLRFSWDYRFPSLVKYFLTNMPNCQEVIKCDSIGDDFWKVRDLKFWWGMKKLGLIKKLEINSFSLSESHIDFYIAILKHLQISTLHLNCQCDLSMGQSRAGRGDGNVNMLIKFIDGVYKSSQERLTSLRVTISDIGPLEIRPGHYFRGVQLLKVHTVSICGWSGGHVTGMENLMKDIIQLCPNIRCLRIDRHLAQYFAQIIPIVWTHFRKIQSLQLDMNVETFQNNISIIDSTFSGYSLDSLEKIQKKVGRGCLNEARRNQVQISSILDLKDLRKFQLRFFTPDKLYESCNWKEKLMCELRRLLFIQMLPSHLKENPLTLQINDLNGRFVPIFPT